MSAARWIIAAMPAIPDRHHLHVESALREAPAAAYVELAHAASDGSLSLYVGAGISMPTPALLPASTDFLERLAPVVELELGLALSAADTGSGAGGEAGDAQVTLERLADSAEYAGGFGLATMVEILCAVLAGGGDATPGRAIGEGGASVGHCVLAIDPDRLAGRTRVRRALDRVLGALRASPPADCETPVPGGGRSGAGVARDQRVGRPRRTRRARDAR
jgi:hypothetical protein